MNQVRETVELGAGRFSYIEAGEGAPVVFLHALGRDANDWAGVIDRLAVRFRCIAMDLRGHGASVHTSSYSYGETADDVGDLVEALGLGPIHLVGHSLGANTAWRYALDRPVERLVIEDTVPPGGIDTFPTPPPEPDREHGYDWQARVQIYAELNGPSWQDSLASVSCPVLIVAGRPDDANLVNVHHLIPHSRLEVIEVGHRIHQAEPEAFSELVSGFLAEL